MSRRQLKRLLNLPLTPEEMTPEELEEHKKVVHIKAKEQKTFS